MKRLYILLSFLMAVIISIAQTNTETLTNDNIITLTKIGLQPSVIITKIKSSNTNFDVSTDALINLSAKGVAPDVINEMMKSNNAMIASSQEEKGSRDPKVMHKSGIYYFNSKNPDNPLIQLDAVKVNYKTSSGGYGGYGGSSTTANLNGLESKLKITEDNPTFYFYFDEKRHGSADWFEATSPNEFELAKLIVKKDSRFCKVSGSSSGFATSSSSSGIPEKDKIPFEYTKVKEGIYEITFNNAFVNGEYCFVFSSNTYKVFDFSIQLRK